MKLLFIGDIVGKPGRRAVRYFLPRLRKSLGIDFVVANGENMAGGSGITPATASEVFEAGVDVITSGDHLWDQREVESLLLSESRLVRPYNYPKSTPGQGFVVNHKDDLPPVGVLNLQGQTFMKPIENPFFAADEGVEELRKETSIIFVDMHAETTSEKIAMGRFLDGRVSAVVGTHTHVQTADEQIFPGGTAFLCDAGFTGPHESILGREIEPILRRFTTYRPQRFGVAAERIILNGALIEIDGTTGMARSIERISELLPDDNSEE
ncbi:MAG: TIGR00282 family metallophosphoesterase [Verrucomicrobiota bacterium]|nr:TIGR00282 family metallophosphoesterase [Verrucomicrobiota bacterium]MDP6252350.1 TIGR00282 family metallophosphoesterase [Verrucomicrobiota bacterium]MDP7178623.1 TIGR00282 family metallophosphoesterase [Verrucomicrobiota bacterium]MDP7292827.1 TIGR00282 family metallophosphoesterase [Verrucomicrobiota bacterium]